MIAPCIFIVTKADVAIFKDNVVMNHADNEPSNQAISHFSMKTDT